MSITQFHPPATFPFRAAGCLERDEAGAQLGRDGTGQRTHIGSFGCLHRHVGGRRVGAAARDRNTGREGAWSGESGRDGAWSGESGGSRERWAGNPDVSQQAPRDLFTEPDLSRRAPRGKRQRTNPVNPLHVTSILATPLQSRPRPWLRPGVKPRPSNAAPAPPPPRLSAGPDPASHVRPAARIATRTSLINASSLSFPPPRPPHESVPVWSRSGRMTAVQPPQSVPGQLLRRPFFEANGNFDDDFADVLVFLHSPVCLSDGVQGVNAVHEGLETRGSPSGKMGQHLLCESSHQPLLVLGKKKPKTTCKVISNRFPHRGVSEHGV